MENALKSDAGSFSSSRLPPCFAENFFTGTLRAECACDNYNSSACARVSDGVLQVVRRSVGAPTAHACAGDGSHHSEDISPGRSGPPGEFSGAHFGSGSRGGLRRAPAEKPLRLDARGSLARAALVRREGNARVGAHPAGRFARILSQGPERLRPQHRAGCDQRDFRADFAGARSFRAYVPADPAGREGNRAHRRLELGSELLRLLDRKAWWLA